MSSSTPESKVNTPSISHEEFPDCLVTSEQPEQDSGSKSTEDAPSKRQFANVQETPATTNVKESQQTQPFARTSTFWMRKLGALTFSAESPSKENAQTPLHADDKTDHSESNHDPSQPILFCTTTARLVTPQIEGTSIENATVAIVKDTTSSNSYTKGDLSIPVAKPMPPEDDEPKRQSRLWRWRLIVLAIVLVVAAVIVGVGVGIMQRSRSFQTKSSSLGRQGSQPPSASPSFLRTAAPSSNLVVLPSISLSPTTAFGSYLSISTSEGDGSLAPTINGFAGVRPH